eukprot:4083508-Karenia_brevis.AAC.1
MVMMLMIMMMMMLMRMRRMMMRRGGEVVWESPGYGMFQTYRKHTLNVHQTYARAAPAFSSS